MAPTRVSPPQGKKGPRAQKWDQKFKSFLNQLIAKKRILVSGGEGFFGVSMNQIDVRLPGFSLIQEASNNRFVLGLNLDVEIVRVTTGGMPEDIQADTISEGKAAGAKKLLSLAQREFPNRKFADMTIDCRNLGARGFYLPGRNDGPVFDRILSIAIA